MSLKNSNDTIGNRTRDLPVCSVVPSPLRHRVPHSLGTGDGKLRTNQSSGFITVQNKLPHNAATTRELAHNEAVKY
jgi:hypothetical protein